MVSILLAAYNGERYITGQIESLLAQTFQDFKLYIRDDKSTDGTYSIIEKFASENPGRIISELNETNTGGTKYNFMNMMIDHRDDYIMLCDQDDVWLPDKIEKSLDKMKALEKKCGRHTPVLVYTDLKVVNDTLDLISSSYEKMSNKDFRKSSLSFTVTMNNAAGCTIMYNRALGNMIQAVPEFIVMHDWWLALIAAAFGETGVIRTPTVLYRQHGDNIKGAKKVLSPVYIFYVLTHLKTMAAMIDDSYRQAGSFLSHYDNKLTGEQLELLKAYSSIPDMSRFRKLRTVFKHKTFMHGFARKAAQVMILLGSGSGKLKVESGKLKVES